MYWQDEGYLISKNNLDENSIIIEAFTLKHGKYTGKVYGGASRKHKRNFQIGNKILLNWQSKGENKPGYFSIELMKPIGAQFFDDKKRSACILSLASILKILLPERQINEKIYFSFEKMIDKLGESNWINLYIYWELSLIKDLGYEIDFLNLSKLTSQSNNTLNLNGKLLKIPSMFLQKKLDNSYSNDIKEALAFNKNLLIENFITPNKLKFPLYRNILENYYR